MKIRTIEELEDKLEQDIAWRKKEILSLKLMIESDDVNRKILLRAGIALLCAHFEGFIKCASNYYIVYISNKKFKCDDIIYPLLAIKYENDFENCAKTNKYSIHGSLLRKVEDMKGETFYLKYKDNEPIISTESNPSSNVLNEILLTIGIDSDIFYTKKQYIDYSLLKNRHKIVHGDKADLDYEDFNALFEIVMDLLDEYKDLIVQSAEKEIFLKDKHGVEYVTNY